MAEVRAEKLKRPGRLKFTNPGSKKAIVLYGNRNEDEPDGHAGIALMTSAKVSVTRKKIYYVAFVRPTGSLAGEGLIRNIELPKTSGRSRSVSASFGSRRTRGGPLRGDVAFTQ